MNKERMKELVIRKEEMEEKDNERNKEEKEQIRWKRKKETINENGKIYRKRQKK